MPLAELVSGKIVIHTEYHERHLVQQVPGARYDRQSGYWTAPLSWATCIILRGLFGQDLRSGEHLASWSWDIYQQRIEPAVQLRDAMLLPEDDPVAQLIDMIESREQGVT